MMCESLGVPIDMEETREAKTLSLLLKTFADHPLGSVLNMLLLRSMKQAAYDVSNLGHFGLAADSYPHERPGPQRSRFLCYHPDQL